MSQQKVDNYKKEKYNRKKQMQKEKKLRVVYRIVGCIVAAAAVFWIGFSVYTRYEANKPVSYTEVNMDAITNYMQSLQS